MNAVTYYTDVRQFHLLFHDIRRRQVPHPLSASTWAHRVRLITEEFSEMAKAFALDDFASWCDGVIDLTWVVIGTGVEAGLPFDLLWQEVRRANLDKAPRDSDGVRKVRLDHSGKLLKPPGWKPPNISGILAQYTTPETWK